MRRGAPPAGGAPLRVQCAAWRLFSASEVGWYAVVDAGLRGDQVSGHDIGAVGVEDLACGEGFQAFSAQSPSVDAVGHAGGGGAHDQASGAAGGEAQGEDGGEFEGFRLVEAGGALGVVVGPQHRDECFGCRENAAHEMALAGARGVEDAGEQVRGAGEGRPSDVLSAGCAVADAGQERGRVLPGRFADGFVDEVGNEFVEGLSFVRNGGPGGGEFRGEACTAGDGVGFQAVVGAELRVFLWVEERDRGVAALGCQGLEQGFHLLEVGRVVLEREGAVAPHRREVVLVGQQTDGAGDFTTQDASHGLVLGVRHVSPCAQSINAHSQ